MFNKDGLSVFSKDVSVVINPNAESIFTIKSNGENTFSFDSKGNLIVVGEIHATGFYLKDGVTISHENISGLSTVQSQENIRIYLALLNCIKWLFQVNMKT